MCVCLFAFLLSKYWLRPLTAPNDYSALTLKQTLSFLPHSLRESLFFIFTEIHSSLFLSHIIMQPKQLCENTPRANSSLLGFQCSFDITAAAMFHTAAIAFSAILNHCLHKLICTRMSSSPTNVYSTNKKIHATLPEQETRPILGALFFPLFSQLPPIFPFPFFVVLLAVLLFLFMYSLWGP